MANGIDSIDDDELLYRRIPLQWYDAGTKSVNPEAFAPHKERDQSGLSLARAKHKDIVAAAGGMPGKSYYVAVFRAGDLRARGIEIEPRPETITGFDPSHAELPAMNSKNRKETITIERQHLLASELCREIQGPFSTPL